MVRLAVVHHLLKEVVTAGVTVAVVGVADTDTEVMVDIMVAIAEAVGDIEVAVTGAEVATEAGIDVAKAIGIVTTAIIGVALTEAEVGAITNAVATDITTAVATDMPTATVEVIMKVAAATVVGDKNQIERITTTGFGRRTCKWTIP